MSEPITVDIYCRAACQQDDYINLEEQEAACRQYCEEHGLSIGMIYQDVFSGHEYRESWILEQIRLRYRKGYTQGVIVYNLSRLSRSPVHLAILLEEMEKYHVTLYVATEGLDETMTGKFLRMVLVFIADMEREKALDGLLAE